ncbi:sec-independent protein translocase protein TATB chloroplastic [Tripterygium wilfordii]|uniref:Sec-independent protein translocase protein TATB chloroplastic n=1 Tax=Tripterygium wilfordii TaxID=458696 RepID=A0A7J7DB82_TRIWF|nr:sec-independent protein translocase protein TATB, chloroplastic-like [Tripterygium wilfordii]KAF5743518.1 sec-independent protein translocase protein TATB chloroplastic [Tripterygium wilfordii]
MLMASLIAAPALLCSFSVNKLPVFSFSSANSYPQNPNLGFSTCVCQLSVAPCSQWSGLKDLGVSISPKLTKKERRRRCKGMTVQASLFGVGAPEALVIGVVALLVFGPRGLAEVARNLGKTLRAFQPTIRELQDVSREFKSSLEREIGLDDISGSAQNTYGSNKEKATSTPPSVPNGKKSPAMSDPNGIPSPNRAYASEEYLKIAEEQLKATAAQQHQLSPPGETQLEPKSQPQVTIEEATSAVPPPQKPESER